ncbi:MAG: Nif3-like dinuclear metal center hexameric protein [Clostridiales bacterium GWE2_32_10]|nr:MAG: Nif3-like dinuclear metal center hexameric protein [Clostridiales bacterium GWE2_32_10]HBY20156.1 Nif3-like dinuclear metal center hexameric protein [Clostridiales bacterium]
MSVMCNDIINKLEKIAEESLAESWDNVGLQIGRNEKHVDKILVTLDVTSKIIEMAIHEKVDLIISHHPLIFKGIHNVKTDNYLGDNIYKLIKNDISVYSMHTNMDISKHGLASKLAEKLDLRHIMILDEKRNEKGEVHGLGRIGELPKPVSFETFIKNLKKILKCDVMRYAGNRDTTIRKVALCPGSGMEFMHLARSKNADVYVTGDLKYHQAVEADEMDFLVIDAEHYYTEKIFEEIICEHLHGYAHEHKLQIITPSSEQSPIKYI